MLYPGEGGWVGNRVAEVKSQAGVSEASCKLSGLVGSGREMVASSCAPGNHACHLVLFSVVSTPLLS